MLNREEWLKDRQSGIGASEASAIVGASPYQTNIELWEEKTGRRENSDISDKECVQYGNAAEPLLRQLFALDHPQYEVTYTEYDVIRNEKYPFILATLDGRLKHKETLLPGILEIKTADILKSEQWKKWDNRIPENYYIQVLHQLLATGWEFAILKAQLKHTRSHDIRLDTRHYYIERRDIKDDLDYLLEKEIKFWEYVQSGKRPPLALPDIA
ncbi:MAG TPA: YqaJ viral recombinase family protein [Smithellaceae bacterium]|nr:YqaJ viral recombinase family protein [Smithellaceae bacterium]